MNLPDTTISPGMTLREAGPIWLESRRGFISERTIHDYTWHLKRLYEFLGRKQLDHITADDIRAFQQARLTTAGALEALYRIGTQRGAHTEEHFLIPRRFAGSQVTAEATAQSSTIQLSPYTRLRRPGARCAPPLALRACACTTFATMH